MTTSRGEERPARLAELIAALSLATDLGVGQPMEQALRTCILSMKAARELRLTDASLSDTYYLALLRFVGCTADAHEAAREAGGDDIAANAGIATVVMGEAPELLRYMLRDFAADQGALKRLRLVAAALREGNNSAKRSIREHCEVAQMLVERMGIPRQVGAYVGNVFEHWDGKGQPDGLAGDGIPLPARIVAIARDVDIFHRAGGWELARDVLRRRRAKAYDPQLVDLFLGSAPPWLDEMEQVSAFEAVIAAEPEPVRLVTDARLDDVLGAFADFADLKSPFTIGHSPGVADLAGNAARAMGLDDAAARQLRRAALVHDLGRVGIPNGIWDKPAPLSQGEWERVRLHPYLTERVLSYASALRPLAAIAGAHHERLDGSGYHRGSAGSALPVAARLLAAADAYQAMTQPRPHRPPLDQAARAARLNGEVESGRLDRDAVRCVLAAAGEAPPPPRASWPNGLTDREVEVLRLISRGASNRDVARQLVISPKTAGRHVENIYAKIDVSSRAAAALFALEHHLLGD